MDNAIKKFETVYKDAKSFANPRKLHGKDFYRIFRLQVNMNLRLDSEKSDSVNEDIAYDKLIGKRTLKDICRIFFRNRQLIVIEMAERLTKTAKLIQENF